MPASLLVRFEGSEILASLLNTLAIDPVTKPALRLANVSEKKKKHRIFIKTNAKGWSFRFVFELAIINPLLTSSHDSI